MLKAAVGDSLSVGTQIDSTYNQLLRDKQVVLAGDYDYNFLVQRWNVTVNPGNRYLSYPTTTIDGSTANINFDRPLKLFRSWTNHWVEVLNGAGEVDEFNYLNPDTNLPAWPQQALDPVQKWQMHDQTQFEIWPIPVTVQTLRFVGQRTLKPLVGDTDTADLDDELLILSVAVDRLIKQKGADAQAKLATYSMRLRTLRACYPQREREVVLGGRMKDARVRRLIPIITIR
jgi:hypothetical protein